MGHLRTTVAAGKPEHREAPDKQQCRPQTGCHVCCPGPSTAGRLGRAGAQRLWAPGGALHSLAEEASTDCPLLAISPPASEGGRPAVLWPWVEAGLYSGMEGPLSTLHRAEHSLPSSPKPHSASCCTSSLVGGTNPWLGVQGICSYGYFLLGFGPPPSKATDASEIRLLLRGKKKTTKNLEAFGSCL